MPILIGEGGPSDRAYLPLATRQGNCIPNARRLEQSPMRLRAGIELIQNIHPKAELRSVTAVYNCMGLVFASRRTWIDPDLLGMILGEDEYQFLQAGLQEAQIGDLVVYRTQPNYNVSHIGVIVRKDAIVVTATWRITVMSKWGEGGEYIHLLEDVPEFLGRPMEFWTDRRPVP